MGPIALRLDRPLRLLIPLRLCRPFFDRGRPNVAPSQDALITAPQTAYITVQIFIQGGNHMAQKAWERKFAWVCLRTSAAVVFFGILLV